MHRPVNGADLLQLGNYELITQKAFYFRTVGQSKKYINPINYPFSLHEWQYLFLEPTFGSLPLIINLYHTLKNIVNGLSSPGAADSSISDNVHASADMRGGY